MSEIEKLEQLLPKLSHFSSSVRLRTAKNLLFKIGNGLLNDVLQSPLVNKVLSEGIVVALDNIFNEDGDWKDNTSENSAFLNTLCQILQVMTKFKSSSHGIYKDFSKATGVLQKFGSQCIDVEQKTLIEEVSVNIL